MWFQLALSVDCVDRLCLSIICNACNCRVQASVRLLKMLRRIVCKLKNVFWVSQWWQPPPVLASLWLFENSPSYNSEALWPHLFPTTRGSRPQVLQRRFRALGDETEASKWPWAIMGLPDLAVGCPGTLCLLIGFGNPFPTIYSNNEPPATLRYTDSIPYIWIASTVPSPPSLWVPVDFIPPMTTFYPRWHPKMISPCLMVNIPSLKQLQCHIAPR